MSEMAEANGIGGTKQIKLTLDELGMRPGQDCGIKSLNLFPYLCVKLWRPTPSIVLYAILRNAENPIC